LLLLLLLLASNVFVFVLVAAAADRGRLGTKARAAAQYAPQAMSQKMRRTNSLLE